MSCAPAFPSKSCQKQTSSDLSFGFYLACNRKSKKLHLVSLLQITSKSPPVIFTVFVAKLNLFFSLYFFCIQRGTVFTVEIDPIKKHINFQADRENLLKQMQYRIDPLKMRSELATSLLFHFDQYVCEGLQ